MQTIALSAEQWEMKPEEIAEEYDVSVMQVREALEFYKLHRSEIALQIAVEQKLEAEHVQREASPRHRAGSADERDAVCTHSGPGQPSIDYASRGLAWSGSMAE